MRLFFFSAFVLLALNSFSQKLTHEDFRSIIPFLASEDFKSAFHTSQKLLEGAESDTSDFKAQISYVNIYSAAGMVCGDQMTHDEFEKNLKKFIGKKLKMPGHPCIDSVKFAFNSFNFAHKDGKLYGSTTTANNSKTNIFLFEYFNFNQEYNPNDYLGSTVRGTGILESYEINHNKSKIWIARIHLANSTVNLFKPY